MTGLNFCVVVRCPFPGAKGFRLKRSLRGKLAPAEVVEEGLRLRLELSRAIPRPPKR